MTNFNISGTNGTNSKEDNISNKPKGMGKATKEPLKFGSLPEAMHFIHCPGIRTEKNQAWKFILDISKSGNRTEKIEANFFIANQEINQDNKNKFISESQKLEAVEKLGELKANTALLRVALDCSEPDGSDKVVVLEIVKQLGKLNDVDGLIRLATFFPVEVFFKPAKEELKKYFGKTTIEQIQEGLNNLNE